MGKKVITSKVFVCENCRSTSYKKLKKCSVCYGKLTSKQRITVKNYIAVSG